MINKISIVSKKDYCPCSPNLSRSEAVEPYNSLVKLNPNSKCHVLKGCMLCSLTLHCRKQAVVEMQTIYIPFSCPPHGPGVLILSKKS